jgi:hypothetical protein
VPTDDVRPFDSSGIPVPWDDGATDRQEAFAFTLSIAPVDLAGNVGLPQLVRVADPGSAGCSVAGGGIGALWPGALFLVLWRAFRPRGTREPDAPRT